MLSRLRLEDGNLLLLEEGDGFLLLEESTGGGGGSTPDCPDPIATYNQLTRTYDFGIGDWPTPNINSNVEILTFTLLGRSIGKVAQAIRANDNYWRQKSRFSWKFTNITGDQIKDFVGWAITNRGQQVTMCDQFGQEHTGMIAANPKIKCAYWPRDLCSKVWMLDIIFEEDGAAPFIP